VNGRTPWARLIAPCGAKSGASATGPDRPAGLARGHP